MLKPLVVFENKTYKLNLTRTSHEKIIAVSDANREKMDEGQEEMKTCISSSWIDVNQENMTARVSAIHYKMEVMTKCRQEKIEAKI
jgi:hypothetical protein